ncbi:MAG: hypothetical protein WC827_02215 [Candidatus Paceibacterota bacterium]|jgi:hypothetical protein
MNNLPFYIITSDATKDILPTTAYLYNKYWTPETTQQFTVLGNHGSEVKLPDNFKFARIKEENDIQKWTKYIHDYILKNETSEYFILTLDDYLLNTPLNPKILESVLSYAKENNKVGRIALGRLDIEKKEVIKTFSDHNILRLTQDSVYRISCQTSIWSREYFLKIYNKDWNPWQLELEGSKEAKNDGWEIIGTDRAWVLGWVEESAISGRWPGMINILGMRLEDVKYLINHNMFDVTKLQYGIWYDTIIPFLSRFQSISKKLTKIYKYTEIGDKFDWKLVKPYVRGKTYKLLYSRYKDIYKK